MSLPFQVPPGQNNGSCKVIPRKSWDIRTRLFLRFSATTSDGLGARSASSASSTPALAAGGEDIGWTSTSMPLNQAAGGCIGSFFFEAGSAVAATQQGTWNMSMYHPKLSPK